MRHLLTLLCLLLALPVVGVTGGPDGREGPGAPADPGRTDGPGRMEGPGRTDGPVDAPVPARAASAADLARVAQRIQQLVAQAPVPVAAGPLALRLRNEFSPLLDNWHGHATFKPFFRSLALAPLVWLNGSGGRVADPARHPLDHAGLPEAEQQAERDSQWAGHDAVLAVAREVCALTGAPLLAPSVVRHVLDLLCEDLALQGYEPTETARRIRELCQQRHGLEVSMRDVVFILRGMQLNGHVFGRGQDDVRTLARRLVNQVLFLCEREQMVLGEPAVAMIHLWIAGERLV